MKMKLFIVAVLLALASAQYRRRRPRRNNRRRNTRHRTARHNCPTTIHGRKFSKANASPTACNCPHGSYLRAQRKFSAGTQRTHWRRIRHISYYCYKRKRRVIATCAVTGRLAATRTHPHTGYCRCPKQDAHWRYFTHVTRRTHYSYVPVRRRRRRNNRYGRRNNRNNRYGRRNTRGRPNYGRQQNQYGNRRTTYGRPRPQPRRRMQGQYGRGGYNNRRGGNRGGYNQGGYNNGGYQPRQRMRRVRHVTTTTYCRKVAMCPSGGQTARCYCPTGSRLIRKRQQHACPQRRVRRNVRRNPYGRVRTMRQPRIAHRRLQTYGQYGRRRNTRGRRNNRRRNTRRRRPTRRRRVRRCYQWKYSCKVVHACPSSATTASAALSHHSTNFCKCPRGTYLKRHMSIDYDYEGRRNKRTTVYYCDHNSMCPTHGYSKNTNCQCAPHESKEYRHLRRGTRTFFGAYCRKNVRHRFDPTRRRRNVQHSWCNHYHFINQCQVARGCTWDAHTRGCTAGYSGDSHARFGHTPNRSRRRQTRRRRGGRN